MVIEEAASGTAGEGGRGYRITDGTCGSVHQKKHRIVMVEHPFSVWGQVDLLGRVTGEDVDGENAAAVVVGDDLREGEGIDDLEVPVQDHHTVTEREGVLSTGIGQLGECGRIRQAYRIYRFQIFQDQGEGLKPSFLGNVPFYFVYNEDFFFPSHKTTWIFKKPH